MISFIDSPAPQRRKAPLLPLDKASNRLLDDCNILVVDDDETARYVVRRILEHAGADVSVCANGREALTRLEQASYFDAVVMDLRMPEMGGHETTQQIRRSIDIDVLPIVGLSANDASESGSTAHDAGMNAFLSKPVDPVELVLALRRLIESTKGR